MTDRDDRIAFARFRMLAQMKAPKLVDAKPHDHVSVYTEEYGRKLTEDAILRAAKVKVLDELCTIANEDVVREIERLIAKHTYSLADGLRGEEKELRLPTEPSDALFADIHALSGHLDASLDELGHTDVSSLDWLREFQRYDENADE